MPLPWRLKTSGLRSQTSWRLSCGPAAGLLADSLHCRGELACPGDNSSELKVQSSSFSLRLPSCSLKAELRTQNSGLRTPKRENWIKKYAPKEMLSASNCPSDHRVSIGIPGGERHQPTERSG